MTRFTYIPNRVIDSNGISDGASIYFYAVNTTTPLSIFSDADLVTPATNPYVVAAGAEVPPLYFSEALARVKIVDSSGATVVDDDPYGVDSTSVNFIQSGTGAVARTAQAKMRDIVSVKDFGADDTGATDSASAFSAAAAAHTHVYVPAGTYKLDSNPTGTALWQIDKGATFTGTGTLNTLTGQVLAGAGSFESKESDSAFYTGVFGYLEQNAAFSGYGTIGLHGFAHSAGGAGTSGEADIAVAGCAIHDLASSDGGAWALYGTALRESGVNGATQGIEIDVANMGSTAPVYPHAMFPAGLTAGAWICTGGEVTSVGSSPGVASVALAIVQNDSQATKTATFDKGIVFHNTAIDGADGATGIGCAIAFAVGHAQRWFNNSGQIIGELVSTGTTQANNNYRLDFSEYGLLVQDRDSGSTLFQVEKTASAVNGIAVRPQATGVPGELIARGDDTNIDLQLRAKGTGAIKFGTFTSNADAPVTGYVTIKTDDGTVRKLAVIA